MTENINNQNSTLLRRAFLFLEDGEWEKADEYAEKVLDNEPENSDAYLCKLLSELRVVHKDLLSDMQEEISQSKNYVNALKYANASQKKYLEDCAIKAHDRFLERERKESNQEIINTFSGLIETYRATQKSNRDMIRRGNSAAKMYLITYIIAIVYFAAVIGVAIVNFNGTLDDTVKTVFTIVMAVGSVLGITTFYVLLWVGHARLVRFWDINYGDDRGWTMPLLFGMLNVCFTVGIWGLVKLVQTRKECKALSDNNAEMERQISDLQRKIKEKKALVSEFGE